ncbi:MAG: hypothetical protein FJ202_02065 [Gemmatimonadetes bacterium]|nr:hypothetical protein [Gemmatimonadota bacterium]
MLRSPRLAVAVVLVAAAAAPDATEAQQLEPIRAKGQSVTPAFEGWFKNADGTFALSFGYFNRNAEEVIEIPIGPGNFVSPGPADRGQPAVFHARRHWGVFTITVPADWPQRDKVTWTLVVRGDTLRIPGSLHPSWQIDALEGEAGDNRPPTIRFAAGGQAYAGPTGGFGAPLAAKVGAAMALNAWVTDDGRTRGSVAAAGRGVPALRWFKHSGPGAVTFANPAPRPGTEGAAATTATFAVPGEYVLRLRANDGPVASAGHSQCCWSNGFVKVTVTP